MFGCGQNLYIGTTLDILFPSNHNIHKSSCEWCDLTEKVIYVCALYIGTTLDIIFPSNHNIHKSSSGLYFWGSDPIIEIF